MTQEEERINKALRVAKLGLCDGASHKTWVIDQMVRALTGESYQAWIAETQAGDNGPATYEWDTGLAP